MRHKKCSWCGEMLFKYRRHICPKIFIHKLNEKEITIRASDLNLRWVNGKIIVWCEVKDG